MSRIMHVIGLRSAAFVVVMIGLGCRETPKPATEAPPPMPKTAPAAPREAPPAAEPAPPPASKPARHERPKPIYENERPFRVDATVSSPDDPQAGWLRIEALTDKDQEARIKGLFPEPNDLRVETLNVSELTIDLSMLPIEAGRRIILHIDRQGIEISQRYRDTKLRLVRGPTGHWAVPPPK